LTEILVVRNAGIRYAFCRRTPNPRKYFEQISMCRIVFLARRVVSCYTKKGVNCSDGCIVVCKCRTSRRIIGEAKVPQLLCQSIELNPSVGDENKDFILSSRHPSVD